MTVDEETMRMLKTTGTGLSPKSPLSPMSPLALFVAAVALAAAAPAADLTQYLDKGYAVGTDNAGRGVRVFKATEGDTQEVVWQWLCTQDSAFTGGANNLIYTSDVKVRNGGRTLLVVGATDWAVIDAASGVCSRSGHVNDGGHGIDILPDGTLIKGDSNSSTSGSIWLIMDYGGTKNVFTLPSCHGVEWDNDRNCVWAIGYSHIVKLGYNGLQKTLVELGRWQIPGTSGHCLDLADDGKLYFTDWSGVRRFDPDTETFTTLYALSNPKSISHSETFGDIVELPTPAVYSDGYSANKVRVYPVSGDASNYYEVTPSPQMSMYRARWLTSKSPTYGIDESVVVTEWGNVITASAGKAGKYDMTDSLKFLCAPTRSVSNWDTAKSRAMTTIYPYDGRLWTSGGDWYDNKGSSPIFAIDPSSGAFSADYIAGTETVWYFREGSDGSLYVPGVDQNERHSNSDQGGAYFQRRNDGTWVKYLSNSNQTDRILRVPFGSIPQSGYTSSPSYEGMLMHTFDLVNWKGKTFACGYGICWGVEGGTEVMTVATPGLTTESRMLKSVKGWTTSVQHRFTSFLPFADHLFCFTETRRATNPGDCYPFEQWRFDEETGLFDRTEVPWPDIAPGLSPTDSISPDSGAVMLWHPTPFVDRVLYIVGLEGTATRPWTLCSAVDDGGMVKATKVDLGAGVYPFCITKHDGKVAVVAGQLDSSSGQVVNSVWESEDGLRFRRLFTFRTEQPAVAVACVGSDWYFGMGYKAYAPPAWALTGDGLSGNIYKVHFDHQYTPVSLAPAIAAVKDNGRAARLSVKVECIDADSASLTLTFGGTAVTNWTNVVEGETYFCDVETATGSVYEFAFTATPDAGDSHTASGAFAASAVDGWFRVDFDDAGYKTGAGWTDLSLVSNPGGTWSDASGTSILVDATAHAPRHVEMDGNQEIAYTPTAPSDAGADVVVTGRVAVAASKLADAKTEDGLIASLFFADVAGEIVPHGFADGAWHALSRGTGLQSGQWVDYAVEIDLNSSAAPRVQYRIDGEALADGSGVAWLPLGAAPERVSVVAFRGMGCIGSFSGDTRAKIVTKYPIPVIGGGGESGGAAGGGLAFGADGATGSRTFSATVTNPVAGAYYTAFTSTELDGTFRAECIVQAKDGDEVIPLGVDATAPSKFVIIVSATRCLSTGTEGL